MVLPFALSRRLSWIAALAALAGTACQSSPSGPNAEGRGKSPEAPAAKVIAPASPGAPPSDALPSVGLRAEGQLGTGSGVLLIDIAPPVGAKLTLDAPLSARGSGGIGLEFPRRLGGALSDHALPLRLPIEVADGATGPAHVDVSYYWCTDGNEAACRREQARLIVELDLTGHNGAGGEAHVSYRALGDKS